MTYPSGTVGSLRGGRGGLPGDPPVYTPVYTVASSTYVSIVRSVMEHRSCPSPGAGAILFHRNVSYAEVVLVSRCCARDSLRLVSLLCDITRLKYSLGISSISVLHLPGFSLLGHTVKN